MDIIKDATNNNRTVFITTTIFLLIAIICLIINYSIDNSINWSLYPIGGLIVIWATLIPMLILNRYKALGLFVGLTITLIPFIFLVQNQVTIKGWAVPLAMPIMTLSLMALGVALIAFTNKKLNKFYAVALTVFLFGVIVNYGVGVIVNRFLNENNVLDIFRVTTISISIILIFIFTAYFKRKEIQAT
ncbi:DUF6320 domain-containing protein [Flavobacteriaceae bacterium KMM 6897]|nr:DUF6320 domain-containing protein [Flavobacteriaceae bacterium KMM 6897]MEB8346770.1 DUF6320 domain-containing protein [Flavobacteriaceae bacterium KMM 6898]